MVKWTALLFSLFRLFLRCLLGVFLLADIFFLLLLSVLRSRFLLLFLVLLFEELFESFGSRALILLVLLFVPRKQECLLVDAGPEEPLPSESGCVESLHARYQTNVTLGDLCHL